MAIPDTDIITWSTVESENKPTDATFIGRNLARQWRNIKSIEREESLDKEFEKTGYLTAAAGSIGSGAAVITIVGEGDLTDIITVRRKMRLTPVAGGDATYVSVGAITYNGGTDTNSIALIELTDTVGSEEYEVDLGVVNPEQSCFPQAYDEGQVVITDPATSAVATFANGVRGLDLSYFVKTIVVSSTGASPSDVVTRIEKDVDEMTIHIKAAPGGGFATTINWAIFRMLP
jgi:hypothetical protein